MSNPFAALFEDIDRSADPILAEGDFELTDEMFAPMSAPAPPRKPAASRGAASKKAQPESPALQEVFAPSPPTRAKVMQQALIVTLGVEEQIMELNDLLASGWSVVKTEAFQASGGEPGSLMVVVEQEVPV